MTLSTKMNWQATAEFCILYCACLRESYSRASKIRMAFDIPSLYKWRHERVSCLDLSVGRKTTEDMRLCYFGSPQPSEFPTRVITNILWCFQVLCLKSSKDALNFATVQQAGFNVPTWNWTVRYFLKKNKQATETTHVIYIFPGRWLNILRQRLIKIFFFMEILKSQF